MQWEKKASDTLDDLTRVVREPFRSIIINSAQKHAEKYAEVRKSPHVTTKEAVLGFLRARSHKLSIEATMILTEHHLTEEDFLKYPTNS
ncbi:MAG: hypothetical protein WCT99_09625 [Bacteroidota bacterium]|jgi:hypothetical protein